MYAVLAFLCRLTVFVLLSVLSTFASRRYILSLYERLLVSTLQVLIFCLVMALYEICWWIMRGMSSVELYRTVEERRFEPDDVITVEMEGEAPEVEHPLPDDSASRVSQTSKEIVFANSQELRRHIWWVYYLGILMWCTVFCLDMTLLSCTFFFSVGILLGWLVFSLLQCKESTASHCLRLVYFLLLGLLVVFYLVTHKEVIDPNTKLVSRDALLAIVMPLLTGMGWINMPSKELTRTIQTSFFTCCLLCMPMIAFVNTKMYEDIFAAAPPEIMLYILAVEPVLKAMAVYTIALSLQTGRKLDLLIVLFVVVHLDDMLFLHMEHALMACTVTVMVILVCMHAVCLVLTTPP